MLYINDFLTVACRYSVSSFPVPLNIKRGETAVSPAAGQSFLIFILPQFKSARRQRHNFNTQSEKATLKEAQLNYVEAQNGIVEYPVGNSSTCNLFDMCHLCFDERCLSASE